MMPRLFSFLVFFSIATGIVGGLHYFLWLRLVRDTGLHGTARTAATAALVVLALSIPLSFVAMRTLPRALGKFLFWPMYLWMGFLLLGFFTLLAVYFVRTLSFWIGAAPDLERRQFLIRWSSALGGAMAALLGGYALVRGRSLPAVKKIEVALKRLPRTLDGITIVQLTDVHIGPTLGREFVEALVERTNALLPDVIAITGDLIDGSVAELSDAVAPLGQLRARHGVFFVTGNHEYYSGVDGWIDELRRLGIRVLSNERVAIGNEAQFDLVGIDDLSAFGDGHRPDLPGALAGRDATRELVLLAHQPRVMKQAVAHGVGLQLSGHTHGGQIWPWNYFVYLQQPFVVGLHAVGDTQIYVSPGTGYWGPPMRLGSRAEITQVVLRSAWG